jgi:protein-S-isoprenylcysteine O-methyltransferase Ste14
MFLPAGIGWRRGWLFLAAFLVVGTLVIVVRTVLEDRTLQSELPRHKDHAPRVRYRLIPGVW